MIPGWPDRAPRGPKPTGPATPNGWASGSTRSPKAICCWSTRTSTCSTVTEWPTPSCPASTLPVTNPRSSAVPAPTIDGIIAYPVTPYSETGGIDTARLAELVERLITGRVHAIAPLGSTGELAYLDEPEFDAVVDTTIDTVAERVPVIVGVSDVTTAKTIRRAEYPQQAGADAVMILPVSYWTLTEREIVQHYRSISDAISIPIMAYNNPATSGVDMLPELLVALFETIENVTMVKESTG